MVSIKEELLKLKTNSQFREIPGVSYKTDGKIIVDGIEYTNFASNDYLGISTKRKLINEFLNTNRDKFFSSASARLLSGSSLEFKELENLLSKLFDKESALIFNTGYQCNLGVISALVKRGDVVISDKLNHASIMDGMRLADSEFIRYKHFDYNQLENILQTRRKNYNKALIVTESVFSMDGDIANINKLIELKNKYNCLLMVDEAHAFCACGESLTGISGNKDVDIITATFGKALGSFGAFCTASGNIIDYLINKSRPFIFSTSIPPINIAWTNWLLTQRKNYICLRKKILEELVNNAHRIMQERGLITPSKSQIIPIITGTNKRTLEISEKLKSQGYYIPAIRPPTVPEGTSRLRISLTADSLIEDFEKILDLAAV